MRDYMPIKKSTKKRKKNPVSRSVENLRRWAIINIPKLANFKSTTTDNRFVILHSAYVYFGYLVSRIMPGDPNIGIIIDEIQEIKRDSLYYDNLYFSIQNHLNYYLRIYDLIFKQKNSLEDKLEQWKKHMKTTPIAYG